MSDRSRGGFSMIEVMVVVLIIGIIAAIGIPLLNGQKKNANNQQTLDFLGQAAESADAMWASVSTQQDDYGSADAVASYIQKDLPKARVRDYAGGTNASTGPNDISVTLDSTLATDLAMVTLCAKAKTGVVFCVRHDQSNGLAGSSADKTTSSPKFSAFATGTTEAGARGALATRASAGSDSATAARGWNKPVDCPSCTAGALVSTSTGGGSGNINDYDYGP